MADTLDLLTLAEAKTAINLDAANTDHDTELAQVITAVSRRIDQLCGPVVERSVTAIADGGRHLIRPTLTPVSSITTITEYRSTADTVLTAETNSTKPANGYLLDARGHDAVIRRRTGNADTTFPAGRLNVAIVYQAGRAATTAAVDPLFKQAAASIVRRLWKRESSAWSQTPTYFGDVDDPGPTLGFFKAVDPMVRELLVDELRPHALGLAVR